MVRLQCPHKALAAPAPRLSSPSVQWSLSGSITVHLVGFAHPRSLNVLALLALWTLQDEAYILVSGHSRPVRDLVAPLGHTGLGY